MKHGCRQGHNLREDSRFTMQRLYEKPGTPTLHDLSPFSWKQRFACHGAIELSMDRRFNQLSQVCHL